MTLEEQFESLDLQTIERYVADGKAETLQLDFKTVADQPMRNADDKRNFAKALSGFANSDGGIVVWGIQTDKIDDVDAAVSERPIPSAQALEGRLLELESEAASPNIDGVRHKAMQRSDGSGFAATLVPASDRGPHMAKLGENKYYKRSGTSFRPCEHFDLEDMFGRRPKPVLSFYAQPEPCGVASGPGGTSYGFDVVLGIRNEGRAIARFPFLEVAPSIKLSDYGLDGNRHHRLKINRSRDLSRPPIFTGGVDDVIHCETTFEITRTRQVNIHESNMNVDDINIEYRMGADGIAAVKGSHLILGSEILAMIRKVNDLPVGR